MATRNLGQAAIVSKGAYSSGENYVILNTVTHRGGSYMCVAPCQGIEPGVSANWSNYWVETTIGIKEVDIASATVGTATVTVTFSNGTTYSTTYNTAALAENAVGTENITDGAVTAAKIAPNAVSTVYTATLNTTWSGSSAPYSKSQTVSGILASDYPIVDLVPSSTYATAEAQENAWANIYRIVASANTLTFYAKEKPTVSLPIKVQCIRK